VAGADVEAGTVRVLTVLPVLPVLRSGATDVDGDRPSSRGSPPQDAVSIAATPTTAATRSA